MDNQFTQRVSDVITYSKEEAGRLENNYIGPEHLLLGILREGEGKAIELLLSLYVNLKEVKLDIESEIRKKTTGDTMYPEDITLNEKSSKILKMSMLEARLLKAEATDTEHILLAIMRDNQNIAAGILGKHEITYQKLIERLTPKTEPQNGIDFGEEDEEEDEGIRQHGYKEHDKSSSSSASQQTVHAAKPNNDTPALDAFGTDITKAAEEGKLDPVVGREKEIERLAQILSRRKKTTPS